MNENLIELLMRNFPVKNLAESEGSSRRESKTKKEEKKADEESNKFKKVEMPIFNGDDPNS